MFKKDIVPGPRSKLKSSAQRAVRARVCDTYPLLAPHIDAIIPKKEQLDVVKLPDRTTLYTLNSTPLFYQHMDDAPLPHLRLAHQYPSCFTTLRVDRGAIRFVLGGAALMVPGLTSAGGRLPGEGDGAPEGELEEGAVVLIGAEGKEAACAVGVLKVGTARMKSEKKGVAIEAPHFLGDGLWRLGLD